MNGRKRIVIIGGGVIGLCTAWFAVSRGHDVVVIDRRAQSFPGCSYGNAGMITPSHFVPLAAPGAVRMALRWMGSPESPFYLQPRFDLDLLRWGWKFHRAANAEQVERAAPLLLDLNLRSRKLYTRLAEEWGDDFGLVERGLLILAATEHGMDEERRTAAFANRLGLAAEILSAKDIAAMEPAVTMSIAGGAYYPDDAIFTPGRFMQSLIARVAARDVDLRWETELAGFRTEGRRVTVVRTSRGEMTGDEFVVCGGSWSPAIVRDLGLRIPMQAGKGYSLTLSRPRQRPSRGMILAEARVAVTPLGESLRFGGTMEIAGMNESIRDARVRGIVNAVSRYFPEFTPEDFRGIEPWCGLRPCSPDGLPYIGRFARFANLSTATGHAMMGMSLGPITGKLTAEILSDETPSIDIRMLSPDRYAS
ncbi:MAG TPA: FAD-dependent oxidoreductase [Thermoanaerobaculia bacterium]|nr:FAD-dependent oxidoreductase [Thermoanaerobaculia bacterium]